MKEPLEHILRPKLPWRADSAITECGINGTSVKVVTRVEHFDRLKALGQQRTAMLTCMTCLHTAERYPDWQTEPRLALGREVEWEHVHYSGGRVYTYGQSNGQRLRDELLAVEALIAAHSEEFHKLVTDTVTRREWLERQAESKRQRQPAPRKSKW
jgi:hypothetical protein